MLNMLLLTVVMILCVLGIYFCVREITGALIKNSIDTKVVIKINNDLADTEDAIRTVMRANPNSEILVIDKSASTDVAEILEKLSADCGRIRVKTSKKQ